MKYAVIVLISCLAVAFGQPTPCQMPQQFQTAIHVVAQDNNKCEVLSTDGILYFDYIDQMIREDLYGSVQGTEIMGTYWGNYAEGKQWYYDRSSEQCYESDLSGELDNPQIPADATFDGDILIGSQTIDIWGIPDYVAEDTYVVVGVTTGTCFPVMETVYELSNFTVVETEQFYDFLPTIPPFIFDLPAACTTATVKRNVGPTVRRGHFGLAGIPTF